MHTINRMPLSTGMVAGIAAALLLIAAGCKIFEDDKPVYLGIKDSKSGYTKVDGHVVRVTIVKPAAQGTYDIMKNAGMISNEEVMGNYVYFSKPRQIGGADPTATSSKGTHSNITVLERYKVRIDSQEDD